MPTHVYANNNEIASKASEGKSIAAFPDVCFSPPAPPVGPMPLPYPNTGEATNTDKGTSKVFIKDKMSGMGDGSHFSKSMGDESATQNFSKGMITSALQGKCYFGLWSMDVQMEGKNVPRHLDMVTHNHASQAGNVCLICTSSTSVAALCEKVVRASNSKCYIFELRFVNHEKYLLKDLLCKSANSGYVDINNKYLNDFNINESEYVYEYVYNAEEHDKNIKNILNPPKRNISELERQAIKNMSPVDNTRVVSSVRDDFHMPNKYFVTQMLTHIPVRVNIYGSNFKILHKNVDVSNVEVLYLVSNDKNITIQFSSEAILAANAVSRINSARPISNKAREVNTKYANYRGTKIDHAQSYKVSELIYKDIINIVLNPVSIKFSVQDNIRIINYNSDVSDIITGICDVFSGDALDALADIISRTQVISTTNKILGHVYHVEASVFSSNDADALAFIFFVDSKRYGTSRAISKDSLALSGVCLDLPPVFDDQKLTFEIYAWAKSDGKMYDDKFSFDISHTLFEGEKSTTSPRSKSDMFVMYKAKAGPIPQQLNRPGLF